MSDLECSEYVKTYWNCNFLGHLKIKNYKFERVENFKYLGVIFNEDNNNQIDLQERIKNVNKIYFVRKENQQDATI